TEVADWSARVGFGSDAVSPHACSTAFSRRNYGRATKDGEAAENIERKQKGSLRLGARQIATTRIVLRDNQSLAAFMLASHGMRGRTLNENRTSILQPAVPSHDRRRCCMSAQ
ncbi:MAG: hypothetical protein J2P56_10765, partial [Verrucomicrobia bacterium]|nr:hypothetical protein [Verrucomicrobiota bacterium]